MQKIVSTIKRGFERGEVSRETTQSHKKKIRATIVQNNDEYEWNGSILGGILYQSIDNLPYLMNLHSSHSFHYIRMLLGIRRFRLN